MKNNRSIFSLIIFIVLSCLFHVVVFRGSVDLDKSICYRIVSAVLAIVFVLPVHELIHFVTMHILGWKDAKIEIARDPLLGIPSLRTISGGKPEGWKYVLILLAPFIMLTVIPDVIFISMKEIPILVFIVVMANSAGCYYDIVAVVRK